MIEKLWSTFAAYRYPEELVSDNRPKSVSHKFAELLYVNKTSPYHTDSNGADEQLVQLTENALLKQVLEKQLTQKRSSFKQASTATC